jgi:hypothetical protein
MAKIPAPKPKRKSSSPKTQSARFKKAALDLEAAGELNLTDANEKFDRAIERLAAPLKPR